MDEIELFRAARPDVAAYAEQDRAAARARLLAAAKGVAVGRGPRPRSGVWLSRLVWRAVAVGALAVAIMIGVTVAQNVGRHGRPPTAAPVANAAELARHAAVAAAARADLTPRPDQWLYAKVLYAKVPHGAAVWSGVLPARQTVESWRRVDGRGSLAAQSQAHGFPDPLLVDFLVMGRVRLGPKDYPRLERTLPTQPDALLAQVYREIDRYPLEHDVSADVRHQQAFTLVSLLLGDNVLSSKLQAALFVALAKIPDVTFVPDAVDAAGRHGVAFMRVQDGWLGRETLLDPRTYRYLGSRTVIVRDHQIAPGDSVGPWNVRVRAGTVVDWSAKVAVGIVDAPWRRPAR
jgi:hypothetical protein